MFFQKISLILLFTLLFLSAFSQIESKQDSKSSDLISPARHELDAQFKQKSIQLKSTEEYTFKQNQLSVLDFQNEFMGTRNSMLKSKGYLNSSDRVDLQSILTSQKDRFGLTFEYQLLNYRLNRNMADAQAKLNEIQSSFGLKPELLAELAWLSAKNNNFSDCRKHTAAMLKIGQISKAQEIMAQVQYQQLPQNAIIITNGEFDTYPLWMILDNNKNVFVLSLEMAEDHEWVNKQLVSRGFKPIQALLSSNPTVFVQQIVSQSNAKHPVFLSLSLRKQVLNDLLPSIELGCAIASSMDMKDITERYLAKNGESLLMALKGLKNDPNKNILSNLLPGLIAFSPGKKDNSFKSWENIIVELERLTGNKVAR